MSRPRPMTQPAGRADDRCLAGEHGRDEAVDVPVHAPVHRAHPGAFGTGRPLGEIEARAEVVPLTFEMDDPHGLVAGRGVHGVGQRVDDGIGEAVAALGPVEAHPQDRAVVFEGEPGRHLGVRLHRCSSAANRSAKASRASWQVVAPPGRLRETDLAVLAGGQEDRRVARCRRLASLVLSPDLEVDGRSISLREVLPGHPPPHPVGVAHVVELAELAIELPQPGVVTHPVGAQVDQPRLAHASVVVAGGVPRPVRPFGVPVHALLDVGDVQVVGLEEAGHALQLVVAEPEGRHAVESHAHAGVPHHHVGDPHRALDEWRELVALVHVLPPARLRAAPAALAPRRPPRRWRRSRRRCTGGSRPRRSSCARSPSPARPGSSGGTARRGPGPPAAANTSASHSWTVRPAKSPTLSCTPTRALRRVTRMPGRSGFHHSRNDPE